MEIITEKLQKHSNPEDCQPYSLNVRELNGHRFPMILGDGH